MVCDSDEVAPSLCSGGRGCAPTALAALGVGTPLDRALRTAAPPAEICPAWGGSRFLGGGLDALAPPSHARWPPDALRAQTVARNEFGRGGVALWDSGALRRISGACLRGNNLIQVQQLLKEVLLGGEAIGR